MPGLSTDGVLELVPHDPVLAEEYLAVVERNLDRLAQWEPWAQRPVTIESIRAYQGWTAARAARGEVLEFVICLDGAIVGATGARLDRARVEFGYWIDADFEGKGVASRAVGELLGRLEALGHRCLLAQTGAGNARSIRLLERQGFALSDEPAPALRLGERIVPMVRYVRG